MRFCTDSSTIFMIVKSRLLLRELTQKLIIRRRRIIGECSSLGGAAYSFIYNFLQKNLGVNFIAFGERGGMDKSHQTSELFNLKENISMQNVCL